MTLAEMKKWAASWGNAGGENISVTKETLAILIANADRMHKALQNLRERALAHAPNSVREFSPATAASIAIICEDAIDGV